MAATERQKHTGEDALAAGRLDRRVTVQAYTPSADANAEPGDDWSDVCEVAAEVVWLKGRELQVAREWGSEAQLKVTIRWRPWVSGRVRLVYRGQRLNVVEPPKEIGRRVGLELMCALEEQR